MHNSTDIPCETTSEPSTNANLYRLLFVGGPFDGAEVPAATLPGNRLELASGPAGCGTRLGCNVTPRVARYRMQNLRLDTIDQVPVVSCRLEYCGTAAAHSAPASRWWTRYFDALWQWLEPRPRQIFLRNTKRSIAHV
jgi:hypothetical protein